MKNKELKVSVVISNLNGEKLLENNLPKLIDAKNYSPNNILEIIIVDDGSWDGSVALLKTKFPEVRLFKHTANRGFSAAVNTGVRAAKGELILLINTDVFPDRNFLVKVLPHFEDSSVFAVSLHEKGFGSAKGTFAHGFIELATGEEGNKNHPSFYVNGGSGVFRKSVWIELGGMDEKLLSPFYWEDIDLCYRAAKRGYKLLWEPGGIVEHHHELTINKFTKQYIARVRERNQLLMLWKNVTSPNLIRKHIVGLFSRLLKNPGYIKVVIMALSRFGIVMQKRKKEIKESRVSDEVVFSRYG
ncbi:MAG TPA: glycosyltransferase family 2 protein [Patescibacteria group bacterium]|nr:glycosyltransferase family 2 protein [Patescibacteria group bacterium]